MKGGRGVAPEYYRVQTRDLLPGVSHQGRRQAEYVAKIQKRGG